MLSPKDQWQSFCQLKLVDIHDDISVLSIFNTTQVNKRTNKGYHVFTSKCLMQPTGFLYPLSIISTHLSFLLESWGLLEPLLYALV